jgi:organic radical activating enzyme
VPHSNNPRFQDFLSEYGVPSLDQLRVFPKFIQLETVSGCNATCTMCSVSSWARAKNAMSDDLFGRLVEEIRARVDWVELVTLQLGGEPLLDKKLEPRVIQLKKAGVKSVAFTSNASLLDETRARSILASGVDVIDFSIDGASAETFEKIRLGLSFKTVRDNVLNFVKLRDRLGSPVRIRVRMVVQPENARELDAFVVFWQECLGPNDFVLARFLNWWSTWRGELAGAGSTHLQEKRPLEAFNDLPCLSPFSTLVILSDGRAPLCCLDYNADTPMGDVAASSIVEVWRGPAFEEVRRMHLADGRHAMEFCRNCQIFVADSGFDFAGAARTDAQG